MFQLIATWAIVTASFLPRVHPIPDGHINRDIQVTVTNQSVSVDVRMAANDQTWIQIIQRANTLVRQNLITKSKSELQTGENEQGSQASGATTQEPSSSATQASVSADTNAHDQAIEFDFATIARTPTNDDEVSSWLIEDRNRKLLESWIAQQTQVTWNGSPLQVQPKITSRQNGRHHWAISVELQFAISDVAIDGELEFQERAFADFPGLVRRALKARGNAQIQRSDVEVLVVRAEFETRAETDPITERCESIKAAIGIQVP